MALLLTRKCLGTFLECFLKLGHLFGQLREGIPTNSLCLTSGLRWGFLAPLGLEGTIFLILGTLASIVCTRLAPMFLAQVAMFTFAPTPSISLEWWHSRDSIVWCHINMSGQLCIKVGWHKPKTRSVYYYHDFQYVIRWCVISADTHTGVQYSHTQGCSIVIIMRE